MVAVESGIPLSRHLDAPARRARQVASRELSRGLARAAGRRANKPDGNLRVRAAHRRPRRRSARRPPGTARLARRGARPCGCGRRDAPGAPKAVAGDQGTGLEPGPVSLSDRGEPHGPASHPLRDASTTWSDTACCRRRRSVVSCSRSSACRRPSASRSRTSVCIGLQLVEHLQDVGEDARRGRIYLPLDDMARFGCARGRAAGDALGAGAAGARGDGGDAGAVRCSRPAVPLVGDACRSAPGWRSPASRPAGMAALDAIERAGNDVLATRCRPRQARIREAGSSGLSSRRAWTETGHEHRSRLRLVRDDHAPRGEELRLRHPAAPQAGAPGAVGRLRAGPAHRRHRRRRRRARREARRPAATSARTSTRSIRARPTRCWSPWRTRRGGTACRWRASARSSRAARWTSSARPTTPSTISSATAGGWRARSGRLSLAVFGSDDPERAVPLADALGVALQLTNILRDVVEDRSFGRVYLPSEDAESVGCAPDLSGPARGRGPARRLRMRPRRAVVRRGPAAAAAARPPQPRLCRGHGGHLPPPACSHRARARSRSPGAACRCPPGRRRRSRRGASPGRGREPAPHRRRRGRPGRDRRRARRPPTGAPRSCCSSAGRARRPHDLDPQRTASRSTTASTSSSAAAPPTGLPRSASALRAGVPAAAARRARAGARRRTASIRRTALPGPAPSRSGRWPATATCRCASGRSSPGRRSRFGASIRTTPRSTTSRSAPGWLSQGQSDREPSTASGT